MAFDPLNWYWFVNGRRDRVYSSASGDYVSVDNATYAAWKAASPDNVTTEIGTEVQLGRDLAKHRLRPTPTAMLDAYLDDQAGEVIDAVQFKIMFNHENRMRSIERALSLNGSPANLTPAQARAAVKVLL